MNETSPDVGAGTPEERHLRQQPLVGHDPYISGTRHPGHGPTGGPACDGPVAHDTSDTWVPGLPNLSESFNQDQEPADALFDGAGDISMYEQDGVVVVLLRGRIDITQAQELEEAGGFAVDRALSIMVDVRHVDMIDSVGIAFLVRMAASVRSQGGMVTLCGPAPLVEETLTVSGAGPLFSWAAGRLDPTGHATP